MRRSEAGSALLEVLSSLGIASACIVVSVHLVSGAGRFLRDSLDTRQAYDIQRAVDRWGGAIVREADQLHLPIFPRRHQNGEIRFTDHTINPIALQTGPRGPRHASDSLTFVSGALRDAWKVRSVASQGAWSLIEACAISASRLDTLESQSYLLIDVDGIYEFSGTSRGIPGTSRCREFNLHGESRSMIAASAPPEVLHAVALLLPIEAIVTLFVSNQGELRYVASKGARNVENQPLIGGVSSLSAQVSTTTLGQFHLTFTMMDSDSRSYTFHDASTLVPISSILEIVG